MSLADFRLFLGAIAPLGGVLNEATPEGDRLRGPGTLSMPVERIEVADLSAHPDLFLVRFVGPRDFATPTTDPWTWLPDRRCWLVPQLDPTGAQLGWLRLLERTTA